MTKLRKSQYCSSNHILQISKLTKIVFTKNFEIDYSSVYFINISSACDLPTYYPNHIKICDKVVKKFHFRR